MITALLTLTMLVTTIFSCLSDYRRMCIPNIHIVIVVAAWMLAAAASPEEFMPWWDHPAAFVMVFVLTFGMFACGMIGAGDAKLGAALALWVGLRGLMPYMFYMGLMGGILAVFAVYIRNKKPFRHVNAESWVGQLQAGHSAIPYGIALTVGAWAALFHTGFLSHQLDEIFLAIY